MYMLYNNILKSKKNIKYWDTNFPKNVKWYAIGG